MAESKPDETKQTSAPAAKADEAKQEGVTLYNADGREKTVTSPAVQVQMEFDGWTQNKGHFSKKSSKK